MTETLIVAGAVAVLMGMWSLVLYRSIIAENAIRSKHIEGLKQAAEFRKQHEEYQTSVAKEAARLEAAGILTPHVKASLGRAIYG